MSITNCTLTYEYFKWFCCSRYILLGVFIILKVIRGEREREKERNISDIMSWNYNVQLGNIQTTSLLLNVCPRCGCLEYQNMNRERVGLDLC